jgi:signal transduction histidine kinase
MSVQEPAYPQNGIIVAVKDEGPGLTQDDMQKLFTKFARLSARPTGSEHSTGLGLSIVRRLAEMIGSEVTCSSEYGFGAEFCIFIPSNQQ